jgi:protocatechuate 3,4-dioxygenase beta subunit
MTEAISNPAPSGDDDDRPVGRVLTRREVLALLGATAGATALAACAPGSPGGEAASESASAAAARPSAAAASASAGGSAGSVPSCVVRPALTEGPFFVDEMLQRTDIRADPGTGRLSEGAQLDLTFLVSRISGSDCVPLEGALVDVWQCDALGVYSDVQGAQGTKFLRGYQLTDSTGMARITTIYPGWYQGRTVHIHFKIRTQPQADRAHEFTSQLFFDDALSDEVFKSAPYSGRGSRTTRNDQDGIYQQSSGQLTLTPSRSGSTYAATFEVGVQLA